MSRLLFFFGCIAFMAFFCYAVPQQLLPEIKPPDFSNQTPVFVSRTICNNQIVIIRDGNELTKRILGVDAPENEISKQQASLFLNNLLKGENVFIVADVNDNNSVNVYRFPDKMFVNIEIIRQGYGLASCDKKFNHAEQFKQFEMFARQAQKGIWASPAVIAAVVNDVNNITLNEKNKTIVYVTKSGTKYHKQGCRFLSKSSIPVEFQEAKNKYSPCSVCKPQE